jgi:hypothetical protein
MIVGCFSLHLYCDSESHVETHGYPTPEYTGETRAECYRQARKDGWAIVAPLRLAYCPKCAVKNAQSERATDTAQR